MIVDPYYNYEYDFSSGAASAAEGAAGFALVFVLVFYLLMFAFAVVTYILNALGVYTIAKRRGIHHPWLAWIPVADMWVLGSISDQYQYVAKGRTRSRRKVLLGLTIGMLASLIPMLASVVAAVVSEVAGAAASDAMLGASIAVMLLTYFALIILAIVLAVFQYIALYDLFASCDPGNAVTYLVLSIFLGVVMPFFVFISRNKDYGMPQRKPVQQTFQPVQQPTWQPQSAPAEEAPAAPGAEEEIPEPEQPVEEIKE